MTKTGEEAAVSASSPTACEGTREITLVVSGAGPTHTSAAERRRIAERVDSGERLKTVCAEIAAATGLSSKALYDAYVARTR